MDKFIFSILLILLASCSSTTPADCALGTAETIMDQHPDSALSILNRIDPSELVSDKSRALYSLLITQALDKNYIDVNSDSTINTAVSYFEKTSDKRHLMLSLYYQSTIHYNCKDFLKVLSPSSVAMIWPTNLMTNSGLLYLPAKSLTSIMKTIA